MGRSDSTSVMDFASQYSEVADANAHEEKSKSAGTWVTFRLESESYGLPVSHVQEILRIGVITPVPQSHASVRGITNVRGRVVPVADLRIQLGFSAAEFTPTSRVLLSNDGTTLVGLLVDSVEQVVNLREHDISPAPDEIVHRESDYITGVVQQEHALVILLNPEARLSKSSTSDVEME